MEHVVLAVLAALTAFGFALAAYDAQLFRIYTREDGVVENGTVVALLAGAFVSFRRVRRLRGRRSGLFLACTLLLGVLYVAAAGEELSWGQHFLKFTSPEVFQRSNAQHETNVHNLVVKGVKINRLVFGTGLFVAIAAYCTMLPAAYRWRPGTRRLIDGLALPVPRARHVAWYAVLAFVGSVTPSQYRWEVVELVTATMFLLFTVLPANAGAFEDAPAGRASRIGELEPRGGGAGAGARRKRRSRPLVR